MSSSPLMPISTAARLTREAIRWDAYDGMSHLRGFNYQPSWGHDARTVWLDGFNAARYRSELARGKELFPGINCARIWLGYGAYRHDPERLIANFQEALRINAELGLLVIPVLFSVWRGIPPWDFVDTDDLLSADFEAEFGGYLEHIVGPYRGDPSVLMWDICNEPSEGDGTSRSLRAQAEWMAWVRERVLAVDSAARTCVGTVADFGWGNAVTGLVDAVTPHLYGYPLWKPSYDEGRTTLPFRDWFEANIDRYLTGLRVLGPPRPVLSTETCWGAKGDEVRADIVRDTLSVLQNARIGFLPHALWTSGVADLHHKNELIDGVIPDPASMAFIEADGSLRPHHGVFNDFVPH